MIRLLAFLAALLLVPGAGTAQTFPKFTGLVVDAANVLPPATRADLTAKLERLQQETHRQLVVATIADLQGYPLADYGYRLGRAWGVGLKGVNNGIILFIAPNEPPGHRGPRIEVGYGLEPVVTDALASQIINGKMVPLLRNGDISGAMEAGTDALIAQLRASPDEARARTDAAIRDFDSQHARGRRSGDGGAPIGMVVVLIVFIIVFSGLSRGRRGRAYRDGGGLGNVALWIAADALSHAARRSRWSDGSGSSWGSGGGSDGSWGGGGFTGGGGGSFGGGGASGSW